MKSLGIAYVLWLVGGCGVLGLHRFYLGRWGTGLIWLLSLGLLGCGALADLFLMPSMVRVENLAAQLLHETAARPALRQCNRGSQKVVCG